MEDDRYRHLPIVEDGKVIGIVSRFDFSGIGLDRLGEETAYGSGFNGAHVSVRQNRSAYDDDRAVGGTDHLLRHAADEQPDESAMATAADNDQIGAALSIDVVITRPTG